MAKITNTNRVLRKKVIDLLKTDKFINIIDFYFSEGDNYHIDGTGFKEVATAIEQMLITVIVDPNKTEKIQVNGQTKITEGSYLYAVNIMAFRKHNPEPDIIVHEATHALLDIKKAYIRHKTGEAAAFLAQAIYNRLRSDLGKKLSTGRHAFMHSALDAAAEVAEKAKILSYTTTNRSTGEYKLEYKKGVYLEQKHLDEIRNGVTQAGYTNDDRILKEYLGLDLPTVKTGDMPPEPRLPEGLIKKR